MRRCWATVMRPPRPWAEATGLPADRKGSQGVASVQVVSAVVSQGEWIATAIRDSQAADNVEKARIDLFAAALTFTHPATDRVSKIAGVEHIGAIHVISFTFGPDCFKGSLNSTCPSQI